MMPGNYPLKLYHGDTYEWQFKLWLDEGRTVPLDLTDVTPKAEMRNKPGGTTVFELDCAILLPNMITMTLNATLSPTLPIGTLAWDLQLSYASGAINTILAGPVTIAADVTDSLVPEPLGATTVTIRAPRAAANR